MARIARFVVDNGFYHVFCRGHNKQNIFHEENDFLKYLKILSESKVQYQLSLYHYVLMSNHPHLIVQAPTGNDLSSFMRKFNQTYAQYFRAKYGGVGYVWQDRFKSFLIQEGNYLLACGRYIELNPVRAGIVKDPKDYRWSSYRHYALGETSKIVDLNPAFLALSGNPELRRKKYILFVQDGIKEKRGLDVISEQAPMAIKNLFMPLEKSD